MKAIEALVTGDFEGSRGRYMVLFTRIRETDAWLTLAQNFWVETFELPVLLAVRLMDQFPQLKL